MIKLLEEKIDSKKKYGDKMEDIREEKIEKILKLLATSPFRNHFHLKEKEIAYIKEKKFSTIKDHAYHFVRTRLAPKDIPNDGKQTPMKGHPVFISQHATATCCRGCLEKWHKIPKGRNLTENEIHYIVSVQLKWLEKEIIKSHQDQ